MFITLLIKVGFNCLLKQVTYINKIDFDPNVLNSMKEKNTAFKN